MGATGFLVASLVATGIGTATSATGQYKAGKAAKNVGDINAASIEKTSEENAQLIEAGTAANVEIEQFNARMADAQGIDAIARGVTAENLSRLSTRAAIGAQRAAYAGSGVDVSSGSALEVQKSSAQQGELDALTLRTNAAREAWGYQVQAEGLRMTAAATKKTGAIQAANVRSVGAAQALSARLGGQYSFSAGETGAAASIIGGAGNILNQTYAFKQNTAGSKVPTKTT